jgi:hypothetical protein
MADTPGDDFLSVFSGGGNSVDPPSVFKNGKSEENLVKSSIWNKIEDCINALWRYLRKEVSKSGGELVYDTLKYSLLQPQGNPPIFHFSVSSPQGVTGSVQTLEFTFDYSTIISNFPGGKIPEFNKGGIYYSSLMILELSNVSTAEPALRLSSNVVRTSDSIATVTFYPYNSNRSGATPSDIPLGVYQAQLLLVFP